MEGSFLHVEVMQKVPEPLATVRLSQGERVKNPKEKKKVPGWFTEEMKDKANSLLEVDTGEMIKWRGMSQEGMDQCWKNLAGKMEDEVLD